MLPTVCLSRGSLKTPLTHLADPLAFRPNPQNLVDAQDDDSDDESVASKASSSGDKDKIYRPPRLAPMPYNPTTTSKEKRASKRTALPPPTALRALADPAQPHAESSSVAKTPPCTAPIGL